MGDPRKRKKKFEHPRKLWDATRIKEEHSLVTEYGLKSIRELWSTIFKLKKIRRNARKLIAAGERKQDEAKKGMDRLLRLGIAKEGATLPDLLTVSIRDVLDRRLQSQVVKQGLAKSYKQARQLITHGFVAVGGKRVSSPSYTVPKSRESEITYFKKIDLSAGIDSAGRKGADSDEGEKKEATD